MSKAAREMAILTLALLAALLIVVSDEPIYGLLLGSWALMGWFWFRDKQQEVTVDASDLDPKDVKAYRQQHRGATISDAVNALGQPKP